MLIPHTGLLQRRGRFRSREILETLAWHLQATIHNAHYGSLDHPRGALLMSIIAVCAFYLSLHALMVQSQVERAWTLWKTGMFPRKEDVPKFTCEDWHHRIADYQLLIASLDEDAWLNILTDAEAVMHTLPKPKKMSKFEPSGMAPDDVEQKKAKITSMFVSDPESDTEEFAAKVCILSPSYFCTKKSLAVSQCSRTPYIPQCQSRCSHLLLARHPIPLMSQCGGPSL